jgi:predicted aspartyl protease
MVGSTGAAVIVFALAWIWVLRQQDDGVDEIMANVRRTLIPHSHNGTGYGVILRGEVSGDEPDYTLTMSYDDMGRFLIVAEYHDTRIDGYSYGHDGVVTWSKSSIGASRQLQRGDTERTLILNWIASGYWADPNAPVVINRNPAKSDCRLAALDLELENAPFTRVTLSIDTETWLPHSYSITDFGQESVTLFESYKMHDGKAICERVQTTLRGRPSSRFDILQVSVVPTFPDDHFVQRPDTAVVHFSSGRESFMPVRRLDWGHLFVLPRVNGQELGWFLFDTGAADCGIDIDAAQPLGLPEIGEAVSRGVGIGIHNGTLNVAQTIELGIVRMESVPVYVSDLKRFAGPDGPIAGIIGNSIVSQCVVEYDAKNGRISLYDPSTYSLPRGSWKPMMNYSSQPTVRLNFEGHDGIFQIDTGSSSGILINPLTVERLGLLKHRHTTLAPVGGFGGRSLAWDGKLDWIDWGGRRIHDVPATFVDDIHSGIADRFCNGIMGADLLKHYVVVFDMSHRRIAYLDHN